MVTNKVMMYSQGYYFDKDPSVLIVPILSRAEALNWNGGAYDAIALIDSFPCSDENVNIGLDPDTDTDTVALSHVCERVQFYRGSDEQASNDEVKKAHRLLREYTRAIAYAQKYRKHRLCTFPLDGEGSFFSPKLPDDVDSLKIRKINFGSNDDNKIHPAPDPLLLVTKAVVNLQKRHGFTLAAAAEPKDEYLPSEQSIQAQEEYLRERQENMQYRNPIGFDVIVNAH
mmetsp:Transcript_16178/g.24251  ORF Transcript_16178/g.24251 Transcript_16178/m.24251 type:complete len:228 (+) Transcript_16178:622-1305(+)